MAPEKLKAALAKAYVMKEAPSNEGAFLFQRHPHREAIGGGVLVTVGVWLAGESRHIIPVL